jgi:hypothetical protein
MKRYFGGLMLLVVIGCGASDEKKKSNEGYKKCEARVRATYERYDFSPKAVNNMVSQLCDDWL